MLLKKSVIKSKVQAGETKMCLEKIEYKDGVEWFNNLDAEVVDLWFKTQNGETFYQRETFSFHKLSNFGKLIRGILGLPNNAILREVDTDELIGKAVIGEVFHWSNNHGDTFDKAKNFRPIDSTEFGGTI